MKRLFFLMLTVFCLSLESISSQKKDGANNFKYYKAVEILDNGGDSEEARQLVVDNVKENPMHIDSYLLIAEIDRGEGDYSSALRAVDQALDNNHKGSGCSEAVLLWWKAIIYDELGESRKAAGIMEKVVKMARKQDKNYLLSMMEDLAQFRYNLKEYDASDAIYHDIIDKDESALLSRVGLARNMNARGMYDDALMLLDECVRLDEDYAYIYKVKMQAHEGKKEYKRMIDAMMTLYEKTDDVEYLVLDNFKLDEKYSIAIIKEKIASENDNFIWRLVLACLYGELNMYTQMLPLLDSLIEEYGLDENLLEARAGCYENLGVTELALADMYKVLEICDENSREYYFARRSEIHRYAGNYMDAIEDITEYLNRFPTEAYGYYARGWCKELSGDLEGAMNDYNEGIAVDEDYPYIYLMRGSLYLKNGDKELADLDFQEVVKKDTVVAEGSCRQYALYFLGDSENALEWMEKLMALDPDSPGNWYDKACLFARMNRCDESVEALQVAFEKGYRSFAHIEHDDDLDTIRDREDFKALIHKYQQILVGELGSLCKKVESEEEGVVSQVDMRKMYGGTYEVACTVNGLPLKMVFDTGASDVTISSVEANFMLKNGYLTDSDIKGKRNYITASGDIHEGTRLKLREVRLGAAVLRNVEASVVHSQNAPLLLGQSVIEKFGTISIDNVNSKLLIKQ